MSMSEIGMDFRWIFMGQGSLAPLSSALLSLKIERWEVFILVVNGRLKIAYPINVLPMVNWLHVRHNSVGGVLCNNYSLGLPTKWFHTSLLNLSASLGIVRSLLHVIVDTTWGQAVDPPRHDVLASYPNCKWELNMSTSLIVPCCWSHTGWTKRSLIVQEIVAAMDLPELTFNRVKDRLDGAQLIKWVVLAPPGKVCQLAHAILQHVCLHDKLSEVASVAHARKEEPEK
mmetsp:Transcript_20351/g.28602  ORF Transcript_20351/g.28602 Transcript_20351/m.28602 type:complete len:229 (+) Transcript_20351:3263-3949(+)